MKTQPLNPLRCGLAIVALSSFLIGCRPSPPTETSAPSPPQAETISSEQQTAATLSDIQEQPVWVKPTNTKKEVSGEEGMGLQIGETIRTEGEALAQIDLSNGLAFRIGGDASLTLQSGDRLNLNSGEMITWVEPGQTVPAEIVTPGGTAGIRGTTVYVNIPENPEEGILFFSWEGTVAVSLPELDEEIILESGDQLRLPKGERDIEKIRAAVRHLSPEEWKERRRKSRLLNKFDKPLSTLDKIEAIDRKMNERKTNRDNPR